MRRIILWIVGLFVLSLGSSAWAQCSWNFALTGADGVQLWDGDVLIGTGTGTVSVGDNGRDLSVVFHFSNEMDPGQNVGEAFFWTCGTSYANAQHRFKITAEGPEWNDLPAPWEKEFSRPVGLSCKGCCANKQCDLDCDGVTNDDDDDDDGDGTEDCDDNDDDADSIDDDIDDNPGNWDEGWGWIENPPPPGDEWVGGPPDPLPCCPPGSDGANCDEPCGPVDPDDFDGDGILNNNDPDDDNDGTPDCEDPDDDNDGIEDDGDPDDDNDGVPDDQDAQPGGCRCGEDFDCDGIDNNTDEDDDNDGTPDATDEDDDNDGIPDDQDPDDDNDGIPDDEDEQPGGCPPEDRNCNGVPDEQEEGDCQPPPPNDHDCDDVPNNCDPNYQPCVDANSNGKCDHCDEDCENPPCCPQKQVDHDCDGVPNLCDWDYVGPGPSCPDLNGNHVCDGCECDPSDPDYPNCVEPCADPPANDHDCDGVHNECDKDYDPSGCLDANNNRICDHCEEAIPPIGPAPNMTLPEAPTVEWEVPSLDLSSGAYDFDIHLPWVGGGTQQLHVSTDPNAWDDSGLVSELPMSPILFTVVDNLRQFVRLMLQIMLLWSMGPRFIRIFHTT